MASADNSSTSVEGGPPDGIVVIDFGGQYCHLIARRIREMNVYSEIISSDSTPEDLQPLRNVMRIKGLILSGGPSSVLEPSSPRLDEGFLRLDIPILGICYGHQLLAQISGGVVRRAEVKEYGVAEAFIERPVGVLKGLGPLERVWMSHGDTVFEVPEEFEVLARTEACPVAAFRHVSKPIYGLQWHPEVEHTERGREMLRNYVFIVCGCHPNWSPTDLTEEAVRMIREIVGSSRAVIALSGGVDSGVAAILAARALGDRLVAIHVDNGLMRRDESREVEKTFRSLGVNLVVVQAQRRFLEKLKGVVDPEEKRRLIGEEFIRVFEEEAEKADAEYLIQGTIYPDRIESGFRRHSDKIKTHHNVGGLPLKIEFKSIVEPLRNLYKDEVRALGLRLGLPEHIVFRQPFPGPGLAVRIIGEVTEDRLNILRRADIILQEEIEASGMGRRLWQYFTVLTDTMSTGVKGDERAYGWVVAIRLVESVDGMTASFHKAPWELLEKISTRITNEIPEVTRVVYDITHKPPSTIEWE